MKKHRVVSALMLMLAMMVPPAVARTVNVCISDRPVPPLTFPDHEGPLQWLIRTAVTASGHEVQFLVAPFRRCRKGLEADHTDYDVVLTISDIPANQDIYAFPRLPNGELDSSKQIAQVDHMVLRRKGESVQWDGRAFSNLSRPVMYQAGYKNLEEMLNALEVSADPSSNTEEQTLRKLLLKRGDAAIILSDIADSLVQKAEFKGRFDILPTPFARYTLYAAFNKTYYAENKDFVEEIWMRMKTLRNSSEYKKLKVSPAR